MAGVVRGQRERLADDLHRELTAHPHQDKRQLLAALRKRGWWGLTTSAVNSVLYERGEQFVHDGGTLPKWRAARDASASVPPRRRPQTARPASAERALPRLYRGHPPRDWQWEAIAAWQASGRRGVVEAVTGTGKTAVGVLAAAAAVEAGQKVLVLVPGRELLDQWYATLVRDLPTVCVGRFGDGNKDGLDRCSVLVSTVHSAARWWMLPDGARGLLIADEVHRYGADSFSRALEPRFADRLGLTATYEREDNGLAEHLEPYFGSVVYHCGYERGLDDDILARFRVGFLGVEFSHREQVTYEELNDEAKRLRTALIARHGCPAEPFGEFMKAVSGLSAGGTDDSKGTMTARRYLSVFSQRRMLMADSSRKVAALRSLAPVLSQAQRALVFTETVESARTAADTLTLPGIRAEPYTSELDRAERRRLLAAFKAGSVRLLAAPRVLDEGVDVPEADVGVIVAASRSRRQMIQRMGRIIRPKADRRPATFVVLYVRGTSEDPENKAHGTFIEQLTGVADEIRMFSADAGSAELLDWYRGSRR